MASKARLISISLISATLWPLFKTLGYTGPIDGMRIIDILNVVVLNFFDHSLRGAPVAGELFTDMPEIVRQDPIG